MTEDLPKLNKAIHEKQLPVIGVRAPGKEG
jgi:hypothetical protein